MVYLQQWGTAADDAVKGAGQATNHTERKAAHLKINFNCTRILNVKIKREPEVI